MRLPRRDRALGSAPGHSRGHHLFDRRRSARRSQPGHGAGGARGLLHLQRPRSALDVGSGSLALVDPRDQKSYRIVFSPFAIPNVRNLRIGQMVRVSASYNGSDYAATDLSVY